MASDPPPSRMTAGKATATIAWLFHSTAKAAATPPSLDANAAEGCETRRSVPRLWKWLLGVDFVSLKYLRLYCETIGLSRFDLINVRLRRLGKIMVQGHNTPERLRDRTASWVSESLGCKTAVASTKLDLQQCFLGQEPKISDGVSKHLYKPLEGNDAIRLLVLDRSQTSNAIKVTLVPSRLSNSPAYGAVSYEWDQKVSNTSLGPKIILNGYSTTVQPSLYQFLARLKRYDYHLPLWVDALCINQADDVEKSHQVAMMGDIYHSADSVLVWLGNDSEGAENIMRLIDGQSPLRLMHMDDAPFGTRHMKRNRTRPSFASPVHPFVDELLIDRAVIRLLKRTYWTRAWIIQELVLARRILVFCGHEVVDFHHLDLLILQKRRNGRSPPDQISMMRIARRNANSDKHSLEDLISERPPRDRQKEDKTGWLPYLMEMFEETACARRHDKIYSLLGLCHFYKEGLAHPIVPDYRLSRVQLFQQTFNTFIRERRPKYAEILRRALALEWEDLLIGTPVQAHADCFLDSESAFWWDIAWGAAITEISPATDTTSAEPDYCHFETDYIQRHENLDSFHPQIEQYSMETKGVTKATIKPGDILLGLAGTALAVVLSEPEGKFMGLSLMTGVQGAPGGDIAHFAYERVLLPGFLTKTSFVGDRYRSEEFPVRLCVYQFIALLAGAIPEYGVEKKLPLISRDLLHRAMAHV